MKKEKKVMNKKGFRNSKGVTLVEVLVALGLFAIIVAPLMRSFVTSVKVNKKSRDTMIATDVANTIMEGIKGKTYEEVVKALCCSPSGFTSSVGDVNSSSKLALSSINENWYNLGHVGPSPAQGDLSKKLLNSADPSSDGDYSGSYSTSYTVGSDECFPVSYDDLDDQAMCWPAIHEVSDLFTAYVDKDQSLYDANPYDKLLYFGFGSDMYPAPDSTSKGIPKLAYMYYSRIEVENRYFDATVTFLPRSQYVSAGRAKAGETVQKYFTYEVTVKVYEYHYDTFNHRWEGRFDPTTGKFAGAPSAIVTSGILNKSINK